MMAVSIGDAATFSYGNPTKLFATTSGYYKSPAAGRTFDVSPDGQRFLMIKVATDETSRRSTANMVVVMNWLDDLRQRVPAK